MPLAGRKPKDDGQKVNRVPPTHEWVEVPNLPYLGERPAVPARTPKATREWWERVTQLPHCALWHGGDWQFAIDTLRVHAAFSKGDLARAAELRLRERAMGTTTDSLAALRIRYVDAGPEEEAAIAAMTPEQAERWKRLIDDA